MIEVQLLKKFPAVDKGKIFIKKFISIKLFKFNLFFLYLENKILNNFNIYFF